MPRALVAAMPMKDCLPAPQVAAAVKAGLRQGLGRGWTVETVCLADGGEGTVDAFQTQPGFVARRSPARNALGDYMHPKPRWAWNRDEKIVVMEVSSVVGLWQTPPRLRRPMTLTTFGVGDLMLEVVFSEAKKLLVGLGGSATVDGGIGLAQCLGYALLDEKGRELNSPATAATLLKVADILPPPTHPLKGVEVIGLCDVTSPLTGPQGAARLFGPQKGATPAEVEQLETALCRLEALLVKKGWLKPGLKGGGAAGGLGAALVAFAGGRLASGGQEVARLLDLPEKLAGCDLVVGVEGGLDGQTAKGKGLGVLAGLCHRQGVPMVALAGRLGPGHEQLFTRGLSAAFSLQEGPVDVAESLAQASRLLKSRARSVGGFAQAMLKGRQSDHE